MRNYDPLKQSFLFLPNENPKRPIIVPQEYLILNDDSLLQEDIPRGISEPLPPSHPIASQPLGDCEKSYYDAIAKKGYSNNELLFITSLLNLILTKGNINEHKKKQINNLQRNQKMTFLNQKAFLLPKKYKNINN